MPLLVEWTFIMDWQELEKIPFGIRGWAGECRHRGREAGTQQRVGAGRLGLAAGGPGSLPSPHTHADPPPALTLTVRVCLCRQAHESRPHEHPRMRTYRCLYLHVSVRLCLGRRRMKNGGQCLFHELPSQLSIPTGKNQPERGCQGLWESGGVGASRGEGRLPAGPAVIATPSLAAQQAAHLVQELQRGRRWGGGRSPQASHKSRLRSRGQGAGRGRGQLPRHTRGPGREARVRCGCKSSPKCFQAEANQGAVTAHTRPGPTGPWGAHSCLRKHIHAHRYKGTSTHGLPKELRSQGTTPGYPRKQVHAQLSAAVYACSPHPTRTETVLRPSHSHPRAWRWPKTLSRGTHTGEHAKS